MPNPNGPPDQHKFKKGKSGNPKGRPKAFVDAKLKQLTMERYKDIIQTVVSKDLSELKAMISDPTKTALEIGVCTSIMRAIKQGDWITIEKIVEKVVGKLHDKVEFTGNVGVANISQGELVEAFKRLQAEY